MRTTIIAAATSLCLVGISTADPAKAAMRQHTRIPSEQLDLALRAIEHDRNVSLIFLSEDVQNIRTPGAAGELTTDEALQQVLRGTGLSYRYIDRTTVSIFPAASVTAARAAGGEESAPAQTDVSGGSDSSKEVKGRAPQGFRMAQVATGLAEGADALNTSRASASVPQGALEEIVVTAEKRAERLSEVPVPVTAISGAVLAENNQVRIQDFALTVPGFSVSGQTGFYQNLSIRGITTGTANPTVGIMIDDAPFGSSSIDGGGLFVPDIDPGDLARVEVLRGPQGTLYGASSMGGLLKLVTIDPSTTGLSGRASVGTSSVHNGADPGYNARASVNVPLGDAWAVRLSGFTREDPGFIDDPVLHRADVNKTAAYGGRLSSLWQPSDALAVKLSALYQDVRTGGDNNVEIGTALPRYSHIEAPGAGVSDMKVQVYSARVVARAGAAELTAISGYTINSSLYSQDYSALFDSLDTFSVADSRLALALRNEKFTQELRMALPLGTAADWLLGGFFSHEHTRYDQNLYAEDALTGRVAGQWVYFGVPQTYTEYSGFTDLTFHLTDRFDLQLGARDSQIRQASSETQVGAAYAALIGSPDPNIYPPIHASVNAFTYLLTPRFKLSPDWMAYARLASGYRPGGPNVSPGVPPQYQPDKTLNYEIGVKGDALDRKVYVEGSLYYIDWKNIQLTLLDPQVYQGYTANASRARSQGLELSVNVTPFAGLTVSSWVTWNTAVLKQGFPYSGMLYEAYGAPGDRLPYGSRFSGNISVTEQFRLTSRATATLGLIESYVGNQVGGFQDATVPGAAPARQYYPAYARMDLRAGISYDSWSLNLFANNVTNRFALLPLGGLDASPLPPPSYFTVLQPRVVGVNLTRSF